MKTCGLSFLKRGIAVAMMAVTAFMLPATPLHVSNVQAAEVKSSGEYIKEVKLFIKKDGTVNDAMSWCESQGDDWKVLKGDQEGNLNSGASGAFTKDVGVFFCYQTTTDPNEAVTDLAVMNEKGDYSEGEYENLLKKQKETYIDMVKNMKTMIEEYRKNYEKQTPMAVRSHDFLNTFKEDDSGELLGDILLNADDDKLAEILLQCNGMVVLTIQEKLAAACDTAKTTWLDRMVKLGSYDKLKAAFSKNVKSGSVEKTLDMQYREKANKLLDVWDDLQKHFENVRNFAEEVGLTGATQEQIEKWQENVQPGDEGYTTYLEYMTLLGLGKYKYGDKTLLDFFSQTKSQIQNNGIETLYPMAACLTDGQMGALSESLSIYQMIQEAFAASIVNDNNAGAMSEAKKTVDENTLKSANDTVGEVDELLNNLSDGEKISIYEGVDRAVFNGGVAVTTDAKRMSDGNQSSWTDIFLKNGNRTTVSLVMDAAVFGSAVTACIFSVLANSTLTKEMNEGMRYAVFRNYNYLGLSQKTHFYITGHASTVKGLKKLVAEGDEAAKKALDEVTEKTLKRGGNNYRLYTGLKYGFAVFTILLSVADIAVSAYTLYKYYNVEHLPIPHHMVDLSYSETNESSYVAYKSVRDQNDDCGDLNGGNARQWLALYYTKDAGAGNPILAPSDNGGEMIVKVGTADMPGSGYSPIHMFGTANVAQNLTFADGDNGYCYNDKNGGTYLYFSHANAVISYSGKNDEATKTESPSADSSEADVVSGSAAGTDQTGTTISGGVIVLVGAMCLFAGAFIGFLTGSRRRKKQI